MDNATQICKNCGHNFLGKYCNSCGEKIYSETDKTVGHFVGEAFHFVTHFDGKFFKTLKTIFFTPGKFSLDYCNGIRIKYFKPMSLFLLVVILYLLFPMAKGLNMVFSTYVSPQYNYAWFAKPIVQKKLTSKQISINELATKYNATSAKFAKPFLLLILPLTSLLLFLLFKKRKKFFFDHFVFSIELSSAIFSILFLIYPLIYYLCKLIMPASDFLFRDAGVFSFVVFGLLLVMVIKAIKRFYGQSWFWTIVKAVFFFAFFEFVIMDIIYNFILFYSIHLFI